MPPGRHLAALVETGLDAFHRNGMQEAVANVVFARPLHLDGGTEFLRKQRRFESVIAFRFASEAAAEQGDVDGDILLGNAKRLGDVLTRSARTLHRRPDLRLVALDVGDRNRRLHGDMGEMRQIVLTHDHLVGVLQGGLDVTLLAYYQAGLACGFLELGPVAGRIVFAGAVVPDDLQRVAALDRGAGVACDHCDAAERLEF